MHEDKIGKIFLIQRNTKSLNLVTKVTTVHDTLNDKDKMCTKNMSFVMICGRAGKTKLYKSTILYKGLCQNDKYKDQNILYFCFKIYTEDSWLSTLYSLYKRQEK